MSRRISVSQLWAAPFWLYHSPPCRCSSAATSCVTEEAVDMVTPEQVRSYIQDSLACDHVEVVGDGHHFEAVIVSPEFRGKTPGQPNRVGFPGRGGRQGGGKNA